MPLSARELLLVVRARDMASRELNNVGGALRMLGTTGGMTAGKMMAISAGLTTMGVGLAGIGAAGLSFFNDAANAAKDYEQASALTLTQVDQLGVSLEDIKTIGKQVALTTKAAFEDMQPALYDIFSSMNVNSREAEILLWHFSRGAVAGQVDVQTAARSTMAIMNAFKIPVKDVNKVMDLQFQLVRKGVGTYGEFAGAIGRVIPSAARANQSLETMDGIMAFLTRNGLSVAQAATSAARGMDAFANPKTIDKLEFIGIKTKDAEGNYRDLVDVFGDLHEKLKPLSNPKRNAIITELLKGSGGTIQARRLWDMAIKNYGDLRGYVDDMTHSIGAQDDAYNKMYNTAAQRLQDAKNKWEILKTEIGDKVIPIKLKLVEVLIKIVDWFQKLSPHTQDLIIKFALFGSIAAVVVGGLLLIAGAIAGFIAILMFMGLTFGGAVAAILGFIAAIVLIPAALFGVASNWKGVKDKLVAGWDEVKAGWKAFKDGLSGKDIKADGLFGFLNDVGERIRGLKKTATDFFGAFRRGDVGDTRGGKKVSMASKVGSNARAAWDNFTSGAGDAVDTIRERAQNVGKALKPLVDTAKGLGSAVADFFGAIGHSLADAVKKMHILDSLHDIFSKLWDGIKEIAPKLGEAIQHILIIIGALVDIIMAVLTPVVEALTWIWKSIGDNVVAILVDAWKMIVGVIKGAIDVVVGLIKFVLDIINGDWGKAWGDIVQVFKGIWEMIWSILKGAVQIIIDAVKGFVGLIVDFFTWLWDVLVGHSIVPDMVNAIIGYFKFLVEVAKDVWNGLVWIVDKMGEIAMWVIGKVVDLVEGFYKVAKTIWDKAKDVFGTLKDKILGYFEGAVDWLKDVGEKIVQGLINGITGMYDKVKDAFKWITDKIPNWKGPASKDAVLLYKNGSLIIQGLMAGIDSQKKSLMGQLSGLTTNIQTNVGVGGGLTGGPSLPPGFGGPSTPAVIIEAGAFSVVVHGAEDPEKVGKIVEEKLEEVVKLINQGAQNL